MSPISATAGAPRVSANSEASASSDGGSNTAFESMLAAASQVKTAPVAQKPAAPQADQRPDRQVTPGRPAEGKAADAQGTAPADSPSAPSNAVKDGNATDDATADADADADTDATAGKPAANSDDEAATATALPIAPDLSILAQIMAGLGKPQARTPRAGTVADGATTAVSSDGASAHGGAHRSIDLPVQGRKAGDGAAAAGAAALARSDAQADVAAAAKDTAAAGFEATLAGKLASATADLDASSARKLSADAPAAVPTAGAIDISSLTATTSASTVAVATAASRIESKVGSSAWGAEVIDQVKQFTMQKIEVAELTMNPAELGPVKIEIAYDKGTAAIHFSAERAETRAALESSFAQLRSSLADSGVDLGNASTGQFAEGRAFEFMQQGRDGRQGESNARNGRSAGKAEADTGIGALVGSAPARAARPADGNVDLFA